MLFPLAVGYPYGILAWIGVNPAIQTTLIVTEIGMAILSILVLFENRYSFIAQSNRFWTIFRKCFIGLLYIIASTYFIPFAIMVPDQSTAVPAVIQKFPILHISYSGPIFVLTQDTTLVVTITAIKVIVEFAIIIILVILTYSKITNRSKQKSLSTSTMLLQKKLFTAIRIQTAVPLCVILLPLLYCVYSFVRQYYNQTLNNVSFLIISSHGMISTLAMILIYQPYRDSTFYFLFIKIKPNRVSTAIHE
uniref:Serpentine Receptor, class H n=1 Tax=Caenorhabditis tropicalis TaxID=1561998 RepID=A0A1I7TXR3_9PELO